MYVQRAIRIPRWYMPVAEKPSQNHQIHARRIQHRRNRIRKRLPRQKVPLPHNLQSQPCRTRNSDTPHRPPRTDYHCDFHIPQTSIVNPRNQIRQRAPAAGNQHAQPQSSLLVERLSQNFTRPFWPSRLADLSRQQPRTLHAPRCRQPPQARYNRPIPWARCPAAEATARRGAAPAGPHT